MVLIQACNFIYASTGQRLKQSFDNLTALQLLRTFFVGVTGFLEFIRRLVFERTQNFGQWICFRPQVREGETPTLLGPLERDNLNHWT
jgi:hypothetical protein